MIVQTINTSGCCPQTIVIGRRGTYDTMQIAFDLSYLVESYGNGVAVLAVKRSQDESAYPAIVTQEDATLLWIVNETDTAYVGSGECQLMWYVDGGLAKTIIYPMVVMRDILQTAEQLPDGYENWIEHLTELGAETQQNAQNAAQSASDAEDAKDDAVTAKEAAEAERQAAETAVTHYPTIQNNYWMVWDSVTQQYISTGIQAEGEDGYSPEVTITSIDGGHCVTITDKDHPQGQSFDVMDGQGGGSSDYSDLTNKPSINNITLTGNKTAADLGLATPSDIPTVPVQSVAGKTGAVTLNANDVAFSESGTYDTGTVGAELSLQKNAIGELIRQLSDVEENQIPELKNAISELDGEAFYYETESLANPAVSGWATANVMWAMRFPTDFVSSPLVTINPVFNASSGTYTAKRWYCADDTFPNNAVVTEVESKVANIGDAVSFENVTKNEFFTFLSANTADKGGYCTPAQKQHDYPSGKVVTSGSSYIYKTGDANSMSTAQFDIQVKKSVIDGMQSQQEENTEKITEIEDDLYDKPYGPAHEWEIGIDIDLETGAEISRSNAAVWDVFIHSDTLRSFTLNFNRPADSESLQLTYYLVRYNLDGTIVDYEYWYLSTTGIVRVLKPEYKYRFGFHVNNFSTFTLADIIPCFDCHWTDRTEDEIGCISRVSALEEKSTEIDSLNREVNGGGEKITFFIEKGSINTSTGEDTGTQTSAWGRTVGYYDSNGDNIIISVPIGGKCFIYEYSSADPSGFIRTVGPANTDGVQYSSSPYTLVTTAGYFYRFAVNLNNSYDWQDGQVFFKDFTFILQSTYTDGLERRVTALEQASGSDKIFNGKKCVTLGDSITYRNVFQPVINDVLGMTMVNKGIGSTKLAGGDTDTSAMSSNTRLNGVLAESPDYVTILGGANDFPNVPIGTEAQFDLALADKDRSTFIGAYSYIVEYLLGQDPTLDIMILGTTWAHGDGKRFSETMTYKMYSDASKLVAQHYGLPFVDLHGECGFNQFTLGSTSEYQIYSTDQIHPNAEGGKRMASLIIAKMIEAWKYTI